VTHLLGKEIFKIGEQIDDKMSNKFRNKAHLVINRQNVFSLLVSFKRNKIISRGGKKINEKFQEGQFLIEVTPLMNVYL